MSATSARVAGARARPNRMGHVKRNQAYRFTDDHDPVLTKINELIMDSKLEIGEIIDEVYDATNGRVHMSYRTIDNWLSGKTKNPSNLRGRPYRRGAGLRPAVRKA